MENARKAKPPRRKRQAKPKPQSARIAELAKPRSVTDEMVASLADQLCVIVADDYDVRVRVDTDVENLQMQKLTVLINSLLENVRRNITSLSDLAEDLEDKVRERTMKLDLVVQGSNDGVWLWNIATGTVEYSKRWRDLLGIEKEELHTIDDWLVRVHPDDKEKLRAALREHLQGLRPYLREDYRIRHADGTYRWMWCRGRCHRDDNGRATFMAGTQTDVHRFVSIDGATGLPNEQPLMASLTDLIAANLPFRAAVIGVPRVASMKEDLDSEELSTLRQAVARRVSSSLPFGSDLAHLSGDYYAAVIPASVADDQLQEVLATPLASAFERPFQTNRHRVWLDVSMGLTMPIHTQNMTASDVMRDAWTSYRAARTAKKLFNVLCDAQITAARDRAYMEQQVRLGMEHEWFVPYFQPIVDIATGRTLGFETLCRMHHPDQGVVSPGRFIPVAEGIGVMDQIGLRMLEKAIALLARWQGLGAPHKDLFLTVNLEAHQIMQPDLPHDLKKALAAQNVPAHLLKIEIVESSVIGNFATAAAQIAAIRALGIQIALDDFGTGYSSLEYLHELSFDLIKIDKTFVDDLETDPRKHSMVRMMCVLAETLGAQVCVEGIETQGQADLAQNMHATFGQGYLYSKPLPEAEIEAVIGADRSEDSTAA